MKQPDFTPAGEPLIFRRRTCAAGDQAGLRASLAHLRSSAALFLAVALALNGAACSRPAVDSTAKPVPSATDTAKAETAPESAPVPESQPKVKAVPLSAGFAKAELTMDLGDAVTMDFVLIRPGRFLRGATDGTANERPVHEVTLTQPFYLGRCEVSQAQWLALMTNNPSLFLDAQLPVERVSWEQCQRFLAKLGERQPKWKFTLPTEAQWEFACRAGSAERFTFGPGEEELGQHAWFHHNARETTHPVGTMKANAWGLHDMHGNVKEWCADGFAAYSTGAVTDPQGSANAVGRVFRGGGWNDYPAQCTASTRDFLYPVGYDDDLGFRVLAVPR